MPCELNKNSKNLKHRVNWLSRELKSMKKSKRKLKSKLMNLSSKSFKLRELLLKRIGRLGLLNIEQHNLRERQRKLRK